MRGKAFGTGREQQVAQVLRRANYLTASLRYVEGPGDILALPPWHRRQRPLIVEVKGTMHSPWDTFGATERGAMLLAGDVYGAEPILAWWPVHLRNGPIWLPPEDWPTSLKEKHDDRQESNRRGAVLGGAV